MYRSPAPCAGAERTAIRAGAGPPRRPTSCPDTGACTRAREPSWARARCTWPSEAAAAGWCSKLANFCCQSGPSSADMRRFTNAQPIGGASLCSLVSSVAYSAGSASGMVASNCATFMIGPFSPPSASASSAALRARSSGSPKHAVGRDPGRHPADIGADAGIACRARREAVSFLVGQAKPRMCWAARPLSNGAR